MNREEARQILVLHRLGIDDAGDPHVSAALDLAKSDLELGRWFEARCAQQEILREKFLQIPVPAGLKEQIISEEMARKRRLSWRPRLVAATAAAIMIVFLLVTVQLPHHAADDTLTVFQNRMAGIALRGYAMDLATNNPESIRVRLAQDHAPANYVLPAALQKTAMTGCAVERWQDVKVAMICFRTGRPLSPGQSSDLWLFVVDRNKIRGLSASTALQISKVNRLITATWTQDDKLYLLVTEGDEQSLRQYL